MDNFLMVATALGAIASVAGLALAFVQTVRLRELRRRDEADIWDAVEMAYSLIGDLEECGVLKDNTRLSKAYPTAVRLHRILLKHMAFRERHFTEGTIQKWQGGHRIRAKLQINEAKRFIDLPGGRRGDLIEERRTDE